MPHPQPASGLADHGRRRPAMLDSHVHLWDLALRDQAWIPAGSPIRRSFHVRDLRQPWLARPSTALSSCRSSTTPTRRPSSSPAPRTSTSSAASAGWADLTSPRFAAALSVRTSTGGLVGIRHQALAEADPAGWLRSPEVRRSLAVLDAAGLPFDLVSARPLPGGPGSGARPSHSAVRAGPPRQAVDRFRRARAMGLRSADARSRTSTSRASYRACRPSRHRSCDLRGAGPLHRSRPRGLRPVPADLRFGLAGLSLRRRPTPGSARSPRPRARPCRTTSARPYSPGTPATST